MALLAVLCTQYHVSSVPLDFNYKQSSSKGVSFWPSVNITGNEWEAYVGQEVVDLDVVVNECKSKRRPSPINLVANAVCMDTHEILTRRIKDTDCRMESLSFSVTPHTLRADFPLNDTFCQRPTIDIPNGYPTPWLAHHIEVHLRAEHVLDGRRYDGEMQMFHLGQADQKRELAAVSILFDASGFHDNARLREYIDKWEAAAEATNEACGEGVGSRKLRRQTKDVQTHGPVGNVDLSARSARLVMGHAIIVEVRTAADLPHTDGSIVVVHFTKPQVTTNTGMTVSRALHLCVGSRLSFALL